MINNVIILAGWGGFFNCLRSPSCQT